MAIIAMWLLTLAFQQIEKQPAIETLWPTSVAGWVGILAAAFLLVDNIVAKVKRPADAAAKRVEENLSSEIKALGVKIALYATESEAQLENLHEDIEREAQDCAERVSEVAARLTESVTKLNKLSEDSVQSREDRRHISQDVAAWKVLVQDWRKEDRERDDRLLSSLVQLRGTGPG